MTIAHARFNFESVSHLIDTFKVIVTSTIEKQKKINNLNIVFSNLQSLRMTKKDLKADLEINLMEAINKFSPYILQKSEIHILVCYNKRFQQLISYYK